jgi:hypothetical protein
MLVSAQIPDREVEKIDEFVKSIGQTRSAFIRGRGSPADASAARS